MSKRILIVAGGTGGHIFPALALADELRQRDAQLLWVGRDNSMEKTVALKNSFKFCPIHAGQIATKSFGMQLKGVAEMSIGLFQSINIVNRFHPAAIVASGAFVSVPVLLAARLKKVSFYLLEQNRIPGRVVRLFAPYARCTFITFPLQIPLPALLTGTPLRKDVVQKANELTYDNRQPPAASRQPKTVLVIGGSQGAKMLNLAAIDMAAALNNLRFVVVTGGRDYHNVKALVRSANCEVVEWTDHPEDLYAQTTLAVTRGGGVVLSELIAFGIPSIIIPFPYAADNHQDANASYLESTGAAVRVEQTQLSGLASVVRALTLDDSRLKRMSDSARRLARLDAAQVISHTILEDIGQGSEFSTSTST